MGVKLILGKHDKHYNGSETRRWLKLKSICLETMSWRLPPPKLSTCVVNTINPRSSTLILNPCSFAVVSNMVNDFPAQPTRKKGSLQLWVNMDSLPELQPSGKHSELCSWQVLASRHWAPGRSLMSSELMANTAHGVSCDLSPIRPSTPFTEG